MSAGPGLGLALVMGIATICAAARAEEPAHGIEGSRSTERPSIGIEPADRSAATMLVGRRLALVVGVGNNHAREAWPALPNAVSDAKALTGELTSRYGFSAVYLGDPTLATFKSALRKLAEDAGPADDALIFFAGHGHFDTEDKAGYLVLADAAPGCKSGCYPLDHVKRALYDTRARHVLVMLDACYAGTFDIRMALDSGVQRTGLIDVPLEQSLRDYARYPSRLLLASVGANTTPDGVPGTHSPFMRALLDALARPGASGVVSLDRLFVALAEDASLPVSRPATFPAVIASHPAGTFLFIEDVALCDALAAMMEAGQGGFAALSREAVRQMPWADVAESKWTLPGARRCEVWHWHTEERVEARCDLGPWDRTMADDKARETFVDLKQCTAQMPSVPSERDSVVGDAELRELALELPALGRNVEVSSLCRERICTLSVVIR